MLCTSRPTGRSPTGCFHILETSCQPRFKHASNLLPPTATFSPSRQDDTGSLLEEDTLCLLDFYVHDSLQRRGLGNVLFAHAMKVNASRSLSSIGTHKLRPGSICAVNYPTSKQTQLAQVGIMAYCSRNILCLGELKFVRDKNG